MEKLNVKKCDLKKEIAKMLFQITKDTSYDIEIKEHREKRSKNANSYMWELVTQIADVLGTTKEEIYLQELKKYGQSMLIPVKTGQRPDGYFKYYEYHSKGAIKNCPCDWYIVYKGSSDYDTKEMTILLNGITEDCHELDIPTLEDMRIQQLIDDWEENYVGRSN